MAPVHVRVRKTQRIQVVLKDLYVYKSQKCDLYAVCIVRYGLTGAMGMRNKIMYDNGQKLSPKQPKMMQSFWNIETMMMKAAITIAKIKK